MSDAEREEILAKLAAIKTAVAELEVSLAPKQEMEPIILFRFSGHDQNYRGITNVYTHVTMACQNPREVHSEPLFYYGSLDPKDDK